MHNVVAVLVATSRGLLRRAYSKEEMESRSLNRIGIIN